MNGCVGVVELNNGVTVVSGKMVESPGCSVVESSNGCVGVVELNDGVTVVSGKDG